MIRRLSGSSGFAGFYTNKDHSINLYDAALPISKDIWLGEGFQFYSRAVHTVLHEIGHSLEEAKAKKTTTKKPGKMINLFKAAVRAESKRLSCMKPGGKFPPPKIILPTAYASKTWSEFFGDAYSIFKTNPTFLKSSVHAYLLNFFQSHY